MLECVANSAAISRYCAELPRLGGHSVPKSPWWAPQQKKGCCKTLYSLKIRKFVLISEASRLFSLQPVQLDPRRSCEQDTGGSRAVRSTTPARALRASLTPRRRREPRPGP